MKKFLISLGALVVLLGLSIVTKRSTFHVERSVTVAAPASVIFPFINEPAKVAQWLSWQPEPKFTTTETALTWTSPASTGTATRTASLEPAEVSYDVKLTAPMEAPLTWRFELKPLVTDGGVPSDEVKMQVLWRVEGTFASLSEKAWSLVVSPDRVLGAQLDPGLEQLSGLAVRAAHAPPPTPPAPPEPAAPVEVDAGTP